MGAAFQRMLSSFYSRQLEVVLVGLENSGKTTLMNGEVWVAEAGDAGCCSGVYQIAAACQQRQVTPDKEKAAAHTERERGSPESLQPLRRVNEISGSSKIDTIDPHPIVSCERTGVQLIFQDCPAVFPQEVPKGCRQALLSAVPVFSYAAVARGTAVVPSCAARRGEVVITEPPQLLVEFEGLCSDLAISAMHVHLHEVGT